MSKIAVCWDNPEQTIVRMEFEPGWTWDEFYAAVQQANALIDTVSHPVSYLSVQTTPNAYIAPNTLTHLANVHKHWHPRSVISVIVGPAAYVNAFLNVLLRMHPELKHIHRMANTADEARKLINEVMADPDRTQPDRSTLRR